MTCCTAADMGHQGKKAEDSGNKSTRAGVYSQCGLSGLGCLGSQERVDRQEEALNQKLAYKPRLLHRLLRGNMEVVR
jgi:hypothetical protein